MLTHESSDTRTDLLSRTLGDGATVLGDPLTSEHVTLPRSMGMGYLGYISEPREFGDFFIYFPLCIHMFFSELRWI